MKKYFLLPCLLLVLMAKGALAQVDFPEEMTQLQTDSLIKYELLLMEIGDSMIDGSTEDVRANAVVKYIPLLVKTLKFRGSYDYPFDSLRFMKKLKPEDESFRLYNWNLQFDDRTFRFYGAIQLKAQNRLVLFPLFDHSEQIDTLAEDTILTNENWFGAQYYSIIQEKHKRQKMYTLLGWDGNTHMSNKKIIDVLTFDEHGPVFGAPIFQWGEDTLKTRVVFEFSDKAVMALDYLPRHNIITYDHLAPPDEKSRGKEFTYVPDGSYDYFIFKKGKWIRRELLFETYRKKIDQEDLQILRR